MNSDKEKISCSGHSKSRFEDLSPLPDATRVPQILVRPQKGRASGQMEGEFPTSSGGQGAGGRIRFNQLKEKKSNWIFSPDLSFCCEFQKNTST